jgi:DNA-binding FrmR family transcriptional regulator
MGKTEYHDLPNWARALIPQITTVAQMLEEGQPAEEILEQMLLIRKGLRDLAKLLILHVKTPKDPDFYRKADNAWRR